MIIPFLPSLIKMGRKDSDFFQNLQEDIEKSTFFNQKFGYVGKYGYLCGISYVKFFFQASPPVKVGLLFLIVGIIFSHHLIIFVPSKTQRTNPLAKRTKFNSKKIKI